MRLFAAMRNESETFRLYKSSTRSRLSVCQALVLGPEEGDGECTRYIVASNAMTRPARSPAVRTSRNRLSNLAQPPNGPRLVL